ncbi:ATP-dependent helicase [Novosphingobium cyanobacteriorum]|uniref:DNA 3'-5' helicase n=1 Tax=Novosphingobium cyanobacteriorum TaxID=3024215 RepID=A0ABT6CKG4_9SPHN|nr:ATP-dependent helicase [Novosphingobium cyanobacteriorum]MDF8334420.1 ATP-dependent helicase [Novosphingobium cyanobacteriorum]
MDAIELGRRRAAEMHADAVMHGLDPTDPYTFVVAIAKTRGLDVETTNPGAASLDNGRATLVPADDLIIHENVGSRFEQAFLIAHEIGHHVLGDATASPTVLYADMARPSEPSPTGIDRVVDYGRRQRREVQMDLFARELLLPREVLCRLHLVDSLTAHEIAGRMNASLDAVMQQLLDGLLLPVIEPDSSFREEYPLNAAQAEAAGHRGRAYLLEAGPGTGKTQTLTARVVQLLDEGVDPRRLLVLTYSNKAAGEMAERIVAKRPDTAAAMWIGTFHAFGLDLVRRFHAEFGLPDDPRLMDRVEAVELLEAEFPKLALDYYQDLYNPTRLIGDILAAISRAKDEVVDAGEYARHAENMRIAAEGVEPRHTEALKAAEVARVYAFYETLKRQRHMIDFGDLVSLPVELLETRPEIAAQLGQTYDHVLVDEYQDVNRASVRLLKALRPTGENLWVVGDARQSIYRFRGASPISTSKFTSEDFPGAASGRLEINYRSSDEIVTAYSTFAAKMAASRTNAELDAHRGASGHPIELRLRPAKEEQSVAIADCIEELRTAGIAYRDQAVLCTGNERLGEIARDLERMDVPVLFLGSLFERSEVKDLLSLLSLLADGRAMGLVRTGCMPDFAMPLGDVACVLETLRSKEAEPLEWLTERRRLAVSAEAMTALDRLAAALDGFDADSPPWRTLAAVLLDRTRIAARIAEADSIAERSQGIAIWQFMNFLRAQPRVEGRTVPRLLERIRRLVAIGDDRDLRQLPVAAQGLDAVRLMTIHGAKGLEFRGVHLPGLNQDTLPSFPKAPACLPPEGVIASITGDVKAALCAGDAEERECLFYVATSRARDRLILYAATEKTDGKQRPLSTFLPRLGPAVIERVPALVQALPPALEAEPIKLLIDGPIRLRDSQVAMLDKEKCKRRFFYTHVLGIGGRRTESDYMRMHEAARTVVRAVVRSGLDISDDAILRATVEQACDDHGLDIPGSFVELRATAVKLVMRFRRSRDAHQFQMPTELPLGIGSDQIIVSADDVLVDARGRRIHRRIRTGVFRKADTEDLSVAAALLAIAENATGASAEVVHLTSNTVTPLELSQLVISRRRELLATVLADVRAGRFPTNPNQRVCPGCPAFFVCGPVPTGPLQKNF